MIVFSDKKLPKHIEKLIRTQERLVRQSNKAWACGVRAEYNRQEKASDLFHKRADRLNDLARAAHYKLAALLPGFGWSHP